MFWKTRKLVLSTTRHVNILGKTKLPLQKCVAGRQIEWKRETEDGRNTEKQKDRKLKDIKLKDRKLKDREIEKPKNRQKDRKTKKQTERQKDRKTERQKDRKTVRQKEIWKTWNKFFFLLPAFFVLHQTWFLRNGNSQKFILI
jgi:hypothetical protein